MREPNGGTSWKHFRATGMQLANLQAAARTHEHAMRRARTDCQQQARLGIANEAKTLDDEIDKVLENDNSTSLADLKKKMGI